jgi:hypothetical protein
MPQHAYRHTLADRVLVTSLSALVSTVLAFPHRFSVAWSAS